VTAYTRPRPIRVAFLVDENEHWAVMLDTIFVDCYSRWGGRFNLIVPCENGAPRPSYSLWLEAYDPDIVYSYVDLSDAVIASLHERLSPSFLVGHEFYNADRDRRTYTPKLPMPGLSALSVCMFAVYGNPLTGRRQIQLVDNHPGYAMPQFLEANFGSYNLCNQSWPMGKDMADYAQTIALTPQHVLDDPRLHPKPNGEAITSEQDYLVRIAKQRDLIGFAQLSAWVCPRLELHDQRWGTSLNLVVGTTFADRLLFWNTRSHFPVWLDHGMVTLNVRKEDLERGEFFDALTEIIKSRNHVTSGSGSQACVTVRSISVAAAELDALRDRFNASKTWHIFDAEAVPSIDSFVPDERTLQHATRHAERGLPFRPREWHEINNTAESFRPPTVMPRHLRDVTPLPFAARQGLWAQDLEIDRTKDYSRYSNIRHRWRLPRRLRVTDAFSRGYQLTGNGPICIPRVNYERTLALFTAYEGELPEIAQPSDETLFEVALCAPGSPWPFVHARDRHAAPAAHGIRPSDKGQYLKALLNRSGGLNRAEEIFLRKFWKDQFEHVGGTPASTEQLIDTVTRTLKKRLKSGAIETDADWGRLAKLVLAEARAVRLSQRYLRYDYLEREFEAYRNAYWEQHQAGSPREEWDEDERLSLPASVQYLCQQQILHQGHEWRCRNCANNNWVSIDNLSRTMECDVCGASWPAPVTQTWRFKLDNFILEGLREHGLLACLWCLAQLSSRARASFYFYESQQLFYTAESFEKRKSDAEIDLLAVVDGTAYLCEAKSSSGSIDLRKFVEVAKRIRPDVAMLAVMEQGSPALNATFEHVTHALAGTGIKPELLALHGNDIDDSPDLPTGRSFRVQVF
jgi:hypothetical protein